MFIVWRRNPQLTAKVKFMIKAYVKIFFFNESLNAQELPEEEANLRLN